MWLEVVDGDDICAATKVDFKRFGGPLQDRVGAAVSRGDVDKVGGGQAVRE